MRLNKKIRKRDLSIRLAELDKRYYELENLISVLAEKQGLYIQHGPNLIAIPKSENLPF